MIRKRHLCAVALVSSAALAWQGMLGTLGWTEQDKSAAVRQALLDEGLYSLPGTGRLKRAVKDAWAARPAADRVALIRELAAEAKSYIMAPAFEKTWDEWIKGRYDAVNHGIKVNPQAEMQAMMQDAASGRMVAQAAAQMAREYARMPTQSVEFLFPDDLKKWQQENDPKYKKIYQQAKAIEPLLKSNPDEFKKQYALLKSAEMGGPDTWAGVEAALAAGAQSQAGQKTKQEQQSYDEHRLRPTLKKKLNGFVALARTVDFAAQTQTRGGKIVFVNPAYERKPPAWKQLFRLGKEPTMAAVAAAEAWAKEL
jgi:hypothetical protein